MLLRSRHSHRVSRRPGRDVHLDGDPRPFDRSTPLDGRRLLLVGGEGHKAGQTRTRSRRYAGSEAWARERFGAGNVEYRWSTHDNYSADRIPFVGKLTRRADHVYVATGFGGWGMTNGTVAGMILCDAILGRPNRWAELYDSTRVPKLRGFGKLAKENANVGKRWFADRLPGRKGDGGRHSAGEGRIVSLDGERAAVVQGARRALCRGVGHLHAPGLHRLLEHGGEDLGLPLPRVPLRHGREGHPGAGGQRPGAQIALARAG